MKRNISVCFPVWNFAHHADPYMASIRYIERHPSGDPDYDAALIQSVIDMAHGNARKSGTERPAAFPRLEEGYA